MVPTNPHVLAIAGVLTATAVGSGSAAVALTQRPAATARAATTYVAAPAAPSQPHVVVAQSSEIEAAD